ncbi:MAG: hypothetical protein ACON34_11370 [Flavobacteriales bacterium]
MDTTNKTLIWKSSFVGEYAGVKTALELDGIEVYLRNELTTNVLSVEASSGTELWIDTENHERAIQVLYDKGMISRLAYNEAMGNPHHPEDAAQLAKSKQNMRMRVIRIVVVIVIALAGIWGMVELV